MGLQRASEIELLGKLTIRSAGEALERLLPGRQGRLLFAYLVVNRDRPVGRDELAELLWPRRPPSDPDETLSALLSKFRRAVGREWLSGRRELRLELPPDTSVDLERLATDLERAESALSHGDWQGGFELAEAVADRAGLGFMVGEEGDWLEACRRELEEQRLRALETVAACGIGAGGARLQAAASAARAAVASNPVRESSHRLLIEALAEQGNVAEALAAYDRLRVTLRDELGASPGSGLQELHRRLLGGEYTPRPESTAPAVEQSRGEGAPPSPPSREIEGPEPSIPLIGRDSEMELLQGLERATEREQRPRLVTLVGDAGVGKSRLIDDWLGAVSEAPRGPVHLGRCLAYGEGVTYWPLREIVWQSAGVRIEESASDAGEKVRLLVADTLGTGVSEEEISSTAFALATTAGVPMQDNPLEDASPASIAEELGLAWPRFLSGLAREGPATVVIEDLHWAEPPMLDMLERIHARSSGPLLIVTTARPEFLRTRPTWTSIPGVTQLALEPLGRAEAREHVERLLPGGSRRAIDAIVEATEGNPLFAEQMARHLLDQGTFDAAESAAPARVPSTTRAVLAARIESLAPAERELLQAAAVAGRSFWPSVLEAAGCTVSEELLRSLERRGFVVAAGSSSLVAETEHSFRHALIREVTYETIPKEARCIAHASVGAWLAAAAGERREEFAELIAYHFEAAVAPDAAALAWASEPEELERLRAEAVRALLAAGHAARRRSALTEARGFASRALALATADRERLDALELKGLAAHGSIDADEAFAVYVQAMQIAARLSDEEALARLRAWAVLLCARYKGAFTSTSWREPVIEMVEKGLATSEEAESFEYGALLVGRASLPRWHDYRDPQESDEARRHAERAIEIAERIDSPYLLVSALETIGNHVLQEGFCDAGPLGTRLARAAHSMKDRVEAHEALVEATIALARSDRSAEAEATAEEAAQQARSLGPHHRLHASCAQAVCLIPAGKLAKMREDSAEVPALVVEEGSRTCLFGAMALAGFTLTLFESGERADAARAFELLERAAPERGGPLFFRSAELLRPFAGIESTEARLGTVEPFQNAVTTIHRLRVELQLLALRGSRDDLEATIERARRLADRACAPVLGGIADWAAAHTVAAERPEDSVEELRRVAGEIEGHGEPYTAARLLADSLPLLEGAAAERLAEEASSQLESMGAGASAAALRRALA